MYNLLLNPAKHLASIPFASRFHRHITFDFKYNAFYFHYDHQYLLGECISGSDNPQYPFPQ